MAFGCFAERGRVPPAAAVVAAGRTVETRVSKEGLRSGTW